MRHHLPQPRVASSKLNRFLTKDFTSQPPLRAMDVISAPLRYGATSHLPLLAFWPSAHTGDKALCE